MNTLASRSLVLLVTVILLLLLGGLGGCRPETEALAPPKATRAVTPTAQAPPDPAAVTAAFYDWYLAYTNPEAGRNALVDGAYRQSEYLSAAGVAAIDATLAQMEAEYGGPMFDPILLAQDLPRDIEVELWDASSEEAMVIVHEYFGESVHDLTVFLVLEEDGWKIEKIRDGSPATADGVTQLFLGGYLEQVRVALRGQGTPPLQSGIYREDPFLSPDFMTHVDELLAEGELNYDPFLLAQDLPQGIFAEAPLVDGDSATVRVGRGFSGTPEPSYIIARLIRANGRWLIDGIEAEESTPGSEPAAVVEAFFAWWRDAVRSGMMGEGDNPLMTQGYHDSPALTPSFIAEVDEIVAGFEGGGYDPFLCAQDVPSELVVDGAIYTSRGASVALHSNFGDHAFVVKLTSTGEDNWRIDNVICPGTPESNATIFYTWYLAYTRDCCIMGKTDPAQMRNPLVDGAYRDAPFINPAFAAAVEAALQEMRAAGGITHDPILQAQAFPPDFSVLPGEGEGDASSTTVIVDMAFANDHRLEVEMALVDGRWLVSSVTRL